MIHFEPQDGSIFSIRRAQAEENAAYIAVFNSAFRICGGSGVVSGDVSSSRAPVREIARNTPR
jgi:hypothetical protein